MNEHSSRIVSELVSKLVEPYVPELDEDVGSFKLKGIISSMPPLTVKSLQRAKTRFVKDRIRERSRIKIDDTYIHDLLALEDIRDKGGRYAYGYYTGRHPIEWGCIFLELEKGIYTPPEEFRRMCMALKNGMKREKERQRLRKEEARLQWRLKKLRLQRELDAYVKTLQGNSEAEKKHEETS